jgi:UDP-2,3-diacylglucosamine pyrophosphatase LpxH
MEKFVALFDAHWGFENRNGHKVSLHDPKALDVAVQFISDFKPHNVILGGDMLDCKAVSHHAEGKAGVVEGLRMFKDAAELRETVIEPIESSVTKGGRLIYHIGNHEAWLNQLVEKLPSLEGIVEAENLLKLGKRWEVIQQGGSSKIGKIVFIHGDQLSGGEHIAKAATTVWEANIRFGHFHTYQTFTKTSPVDANGHTGLAVPCLCKKGPGYGKSAPNKWMQGFLWGYTDGDDKTFNDYVTVIVNGRAIINGKQYKG